MDFLADLDADKRPIPTCTVKSTLRDLPPEFAAQLQKALEGTYTSAAIARQLAKRDVRLSESAISRHRRGQCRCE